MKKFTIKPKIFRFSPGYLGTSKLESKNWVYFGRLGEAGPLTDVRFDTDNAHVVSIFGKRGSGKSYTLGSLLEGLCTKLPKTSISGNLKKSSVLLFDTLGVFQWMGIPLNENSNAEIIKEQFDVQRGWPIKNEALDVIIWIPNGTKIVGSPENHKEFSINSSDFSSEDWGYLFGLDIYQDRMGQLLNDAFIKVTIEGWNDSSLRHPPKLHYSIEDLISCIKNDMELKEIYHSETQRAVLQQFINYQRNPLFEDSGTPLNEILKPGYMSVIVMSNMSDELRLIVVSTLLRRLIASRVKSSEAEKNIKIIENISNDEKEELNSIIQKSAPITWVAIDEAQNILPSDRKTSATDVIVKYVREGRNYGLSFVVATQQPTSIDQRILAQVDTLVVHKLTVQGDIDYIKKNIKSNSPDEVKYGNSILSFDEIIRSLDVGQVLVSNTEVERTFIMDVRPRISVHGGF